MSRSSYPYELDSVPSETFKLALKAKPEEVGFATEIQRAPGVPSSHHRICLLDFMKKILEIEIYKTLIALIEVSSGLSERQSISPGTFYGQYDSSNHGSASGGYVRW